MENIKVAFETLGCKLNQAESELLAQQLAEAGCCVVSPEEKADIYVLHTCSVTHIADRKSRHLLRMAHRRNPAARIVALGCYAGRKLEELSKIEGVDLVLGNEAKMNLRQKLIESGYINLNGARPADKLYGRTRTFIKAQDGCNNFCSYCIVPLVRGREKSLSPEQVIGLVRQRVSEGYLEIVLTGTEIGRYGYDELDLRGLLDRILLETEVRRLRLSSLQPQEINGPLLRLWEDSRLCRHFHLSLQSGSDSVLKRMHRRYSAADYKDKVDIMRKAVPEAAITTDIIVGFPGETEEEFQQSYEFCRWMEFARIHVFSYSAREGTEAAVMPGQLDPQVKKMRSDKMLELATACAESFRKRFLGCIQEVLVEQSTHGQWSGLTSNYIKVYIQSKVDLTNRLLPVKLVRLRGEGVEGEID